MAQPYIKVAERKGVTTITFTQAVGKGTKTAKVVKLNSPTKEELKEAIITQLTEIRVQLGNSGK